MKALYTERGEPHFSAYDMRALSSAMPARGNQKDACFVLSYLRESALSPPASGKMLVPQQLQRLPCGHQSESPSWWSIFMRRLFAVEFLPLFLS